MRRLVSRAILRLAAFTPTDASHVLGDQTTHDPEIARLGAAVFARRRDRYGNDIAETPEAISDAVVAALVRRSAEALLAAALDRMASMTPSLSLRSSLLRSIARLALPGSTSGSAPNSSASVPAATYYPLIGELLGTEVEVPADADVANAIGAVVGKVRVRAEVPVTAAARRLSDSRRRRTRDDVGASRGAGPSGGAGSPPRSSRSRPRVRKSSRWRSPGARRSSRSTGDRCSSRGWPSLSPLAVLTSADCSPARRRRRTEAGSSLRAWPSKTNSSTASRGRSPTPSPSSVRRRTANATA